MLEIKEMTISSLIELLPLIKLNSSLCSDITAGYLYMWRKGASIKFFIEDDTFSICQIVGEQVAFSYPIGPNKDKLLKEIKEYVKQNDLPLRYFAIDDATLLEFKNGNLAKNLAYAYDRRWSDYIYLYDDIIDFKGKKYSGQRNHINKFKKLYPDYEFRLLHEDDKDAFYQMLDEYQEEHQNINKLEKQELEASKELFDVITGLNLYAACLIVNKKIIAISIGEVISNMLVIHVEKGLTRYDGVYPMLFNSFMHLVSSKENNIKYINREDDSGDLGLRISKNQYHPAFLVNKYLVHLNTPSVLMPDSINIEAGDILITNILESDKSAYLTLNTDKENNKYWGYDYEDDIYITEVCEDVFFDMLEYDMRAGDSINFAIRLKEDKKLIGEVILWNFTDNKKAEIGCRLLPKYQSLGYGKLAFNSIYEFGKEKLGLDIHARCFIQNEKSAKMITSCGFEKYKEDENYYYFKNYGALK